MCLVNRLHRTPSVCRRSLSPQMLIANRRCQNVNNVAFLQDHHKCFLSGHIFLDAFVMLVERSVAVSTYSSDVIVSDWIITWPALTSLRQPAVAASPTGRNT